MSASEEQMVDQLRRLFATNFPVGIEIGIGDDAALFRSQVGQQTILSCDWFLEGTHFLRDKHPPDSVGWKCLARALSDIAAMGATPRFFLLALALPAARTGAWFNSFLGGMGRAARRMGLRPARRAARGRRGPPEPA